MINEIKDETNPFLVKLSYTLDNIEVGYIKYSYIYDRFEIDDVLVMDEYKNRKIASQLMEYLIEEAKNKNALNITLEVDETNTIAIKLYHKYGFKDVAKRKNYYKENDGILMELKLGGK